MKGLVGGIPLALLVAAVANGHGMTKGQDGAGEEGPITLMAGPSGDDGGNSADIVFDSDYSTLVVNDYEDDHSVKEENWIVQPLPSSHPPPLGGEPEPFLPVDPATSTPCSTSTFLETIVKTISEDPVPTKPAIPYWPSEEPQVEEPQPCSSSYPEAVPSGVSPTDEAETPEAQYDPDFSESEPVRPSCTSSKAKPYSASSAPPYSPQATSNAQPVYSAPAEPQPKPPATTTPCPTGKPQSHQPEPTSVSPQPEEKPHAQPVYSAPAEPQLKPPASTTPCPTGKPQSHQPEPTSVSPQPQEKPHAQPVYSAPTEPQPKPPATTTPCPTGKPQGHQPEPTSVSPQPQEKPHTQPVYSAPTEPQPKPPATTTPCPTGKPQGHQPAPSYPGEEPKHSAAAPTSTEKLTAITSTITVSRTSSFAVVPVYVPDDRGTGCQTAKHQRPSDVDAKVYSEPATHHATSSPTPSHAAKSSHPATPCPSPSPSQGMMFTGAASRMAPAAGVVSAVCGLMAVLAFVL